MCLLLSSAPFSTRSAAGPNRPSATSIARSAARKPMCCRESVSVTTASEMRWAEFTVNRVNTRMAALLSTCFQITSRLQIKRTLSRLEVGFDGMGVDHRGSHIAVAQHLLNLADVVVRLQQMRCERVPKRVRSHPLGNSRLAGRRLDRPLDLGFMHMITPHVARGRHARQPVCGKAPLPDEFPRRPLRR